MNVLRILVDADSIFFKIAYGHSKEAQLRKAYNTFCRKLEATVEQHVVNPFAEDLPQISTHYAVKGKGNFRKDIYPDYKGSRAQLDDEMREKLNYLHKYSVEQGAIQADGMEADDLVSIWAWEARDHDEDYVICGIDKDLLQIPGNHYNYGWTEKSKRPMWEFVDDNTAHLNLMLQCLTGDSTDNIPGIRGVGAKKAEKILEGVPMERRWRRVAAAWRAHGAGCPKLSYRLLRMLTSQEEFEDVKASLPSQTPVSEHHVQDEQVEDESVSRVSE